VTALATRQTTAFPGFVFFLVNLLALTYVVPFLSLMLFFCVTALLIKGKQFLEQRELGGYWAFSVLILLAVLFYYHSSATMIGTASPLAWYLEKASPGLLEYLRAPKVLSSIGASYCFLRAVYALLQPRLSFWDFARYYLFFPTFFSGPVIGVEEYLSQTPAFRRSNIEPAIARIIIGAIKVVGSQLLIGFIPLSSEVAMIEQIQSTSVAEAWFYAFSAGVWLFLNFSGFSDICIGLAKLFNISVPENFNNPFAARDITDFWRRWHMTLAAWLRTCIYTPVTKLLGGRYGHQHALLHIIPPILTMLVCGLWHGISLAFVFWGLMHGFGLVVHQGYKSTVGGWWPTRFRESNAYKLSAWLMTHAYVGATWVFFFPSPTPSLKLSLLYFTRMFGVVNYEVDMAITNLHQYYHSFTF